LELTEKKNVESEGGDDKVVLAGLLMKNCEWRKCPECARLSWVVWPVDGPLWPYNVGQEVFLVCYSFSSSWSLAQRALLYYLEGTLDQEFIEGVVNLNCLALGMNHCFINQFGSFLWSK